MGSIRTAEGGPRPTSARELQAVIHAEREGLPFFVYRRSDGEQRILRFPAERHELTVGRSPAADLNIGWDTQVSSVHAELKRLAGELTLVDDGLSRNGSYVNGELVPGQRRLRDGDLLGFGRTLVLFRDPEEATHRATSAARPRLIAPHLSEQQRKVLIALCRPVNSGDAYSTPSTNQEIADELHLGVGAVKLHLRSLFDKFEVASLPQNRKRLALAFYALQSGLLAEHEFAPGAGAPTRPVSQGPSEAAETTTPLDRV